MTEQEPDHQDESSPEPDASADDQAAEVNEGSEEQTVNAEDQAADAIASAQDAIDAVSAEADSSAEQTSDAQSLDLPAFDDNHRAGDLECEELQLLNDVQLNVKIELGRTMMYIEDVLRMNENSIVELDKAAGDPVDIYVNDRHVARGEVLVLNDNFCVRVSEIVQSPKAES